MSDRPLKTDGTDYHLNPDISNVCAICGIIQGFLYPHKKHQENGWVILFAGTLPGEIQKESNR